MSLSPGMKFVIGSAVFFAAMDTCVKSLSGIPGYEIAFFRSALILLVTYGLLKSKGISPWGNNKPVLILRGLFGTVALVSYFYTVQHMPLASAVTVQRLSPIFTIVFAIFLLKEKVRPIQWLFFFVAFAGVLLIKGFDTRVSLTVLGWGLTSAAASGFAYNFIRMLKDHDHPLVVVFYFALVAVVCVGAYTFTHWVTPVGWDWGLLGLLGLFSLGGQVCLTRGFQADRAANVSIFNYLGVVFGILIGHFVFAEGMTVMAICGFGLIIGGVVASTRFSKS